MRRAGRTDANQPLIVKALRDAGATVQHLHGIGQGCPDLLVGFCGNNFLMEVKDPTRKPSERRLTEDEEIWHDGWRGRVQVVESIAEALLVIKC